MKNVFVRSFVVIKRERESKKSVRCPSVVREEERKSKLYIRREMRMIFEKSITPSTSKRRQQKEARAIRILLYV